MKSERDRVKAKIIEIIGTPDNRTVDGIMEIFDATVAMIYNRGVEHGIMKAATVLKSSTNKKEV
jgi:hypothetical protein